MKRRGFLGFMGGAVAAGPKLATSLAKDASISAPTGSLGYATGAQVLSGSAPDTWHLSRIAELQRILSGKQTEEESDKARARRLGRLNRAEDLRLDGLRSVSPHHKAMMMLRTEEAREVEQERAYHKWELWNLLRSKS